MRLKKSLNTATLFILLAAPSLAAAQCCPGSGTGVELAAYGLGERHPAAKDLSSDPNWRVYGFERDGITYFQINDANGTVRAIVGNLGDQFWTLPGGISPHDVSVPGKHLALRVGAMGLELYRNSDFSLVMYQEGTRTIWAIEPTGGGIN